MVFLESNAFSYQMNVRIDDINFGNHLCHSKFINIMHNTRALFFKRYGFSELNCFGCGMIMLNLSINYLSSCAFDDCLEINLSVDAMEKATCSLTYTIFNKTSNKLAAKAVTRMGFIDLQKGKLKKMPLEFNKIMSSIS